MRKMPDTTPIEPCHDAVAERILISALLEHGSTVFYDIECFVKEQDFFRAENKIVFAAFAKLITSESVAKPSLSAVVGTVSGLDPSAVDKYLIPDYLNSLSNDKVSLQSVTPFIAKVAKLSLARKLKAKLSQSITDLNRVTGDELTTEIISVAEAAVTDVTSELNGQQDTSSLTGTLDNYLQIVVEEKPAIGIPSGFPRWDKGIGGAIRKPGFHMIIGRAKSGKTTLMNNIAMNVAALGVPVLYLDTEMTKELLQVKIAGMVSEVPVNLIETGKFASDPVALKKVQTAVRKIKDYNLDYHNISGLNHKDWLSIMRRWVIKKVGFNSDGYAKDCMIVIDYIKMMDLADAGKHGIHDYLGQIATDVANFTNRYHLPVVAGGQANRSGITNEDQGIVAGSDKLVGLCSSLTIIKTKGEEDYAADPEENGNRKLVTIAARFGRGTPDGEYINLNCNFDCAKITEGNTNIENRMNRGRTLGPSGKENVGNGYSSRDQSEEAPFDDDKFTI